MRLYDGSTVYEIVASTVPDGFGGYVESGVSKTPIPCNVSPITAEASTELFGEYIENSLKMVTNKAFQMGADIEVDGARYKVKKIVKVRRSRAYLLTL